VFFRGKAKGLANGDNDEGNIQRSEDHCTDIRKEPDAWTKFVWHNKAPPRVKFFAWLLSQGRIQCKTLLRRKGVVDNTDCEVCQTAEETPAHIIFGCPCARQFWGAVRIHTEATWSIQALKEIQPPSHIPAKYFTTFLLLCCWHI